MKKILAALIALYSFASYANENCRLDYPAYLSAKQLKILSKKFKLSTKEYDFKIGAIATTCEWTDYGNIFRGNSYGTDCMTKIELRDANYDYITTIIGPRGGQSERSKIRAFKSLPNCFRGEI